MKTLRSTREEKQARIMDQAHALFRRWGYTKTSVADIARELEMSPANIYKFFPSKDAIVEAAANRNLELIKKDITQAVRAKKGASNRLLGVIMAIYGFHRDHFRNERELYKLVIVATEQNWSCVRLFKEFLNKTMIEIISDGIRAGEIRRTDAAATTEILLDCFTWVTNPILFREINPKEVESRAQAQVHLLKKALQ